MRVRPVIASLAAAAAVALVGCGSQGDDSTPVACLEPEAAYLKALGDAPGEVELLGETKISECLAENQQGGDLADVGETMVEAATKLNAEARADPGGDANLQLGYLLGAAERGAEKTEGIHAELIRRLTVAARFAPADQRLPATFLATYQRGFDAGHDRG
ncbi:MAG TPA: hypothetical protein VMT37_16565 [Solirubrobacterales bacterium]|nr:hypothetical protein [Solirubrobacterales bacterium]